MMLMISSPTLMSWELAAASAGYAMTTARRVPKPSSLSSICKEYSQRRYDGIFAVYCTVAPTEANVKELNCSQS